MSQLDPASYTLIGRVHGHLAVLGLALLLHPVISLRRRKALTRWTVRTADLAAALLTTVFVIGWNQYPTYRAAVKGRLLVRDDPAWLWFESKEHLAALCVTLAVGGALTLRASGAHPDGRRTAWALLLGAWVCGVVAGVLGVLVAASAHPAF